jgi:hypothetical protein
MPSERAVSLKTPPGVSHVQGLSGRQYMTRDAIVSVVEKDVSPLLRAGFSRVETGVSTRINSRLCRIPTPAMAIGSNPLSSTRKSAQTDMISFAAG